jgi:release factor glutamine methyltransferase
VKSLCAEQEILSPRGVFYLITVDDNDPDEIAAILARQGLSATVVLRKKARNEKLQVMRFARASE